MEKAVDNKGYAGSILMDLSKAFDNLNHDLLIAKLHAYGFDRKSLLLIKSYLTNRWQRTKINITFSSWTELLVGVPQGSVLGPLLFNIYINDLFYLIKDSDICNFADDNTFHVCDISVENLMKKLEKVSYQAVEWFRYNYMKLNADKCHLLVGGYKHECMISTVDNQHIIKTLKEKLLGVLLDKDLNFDAHVNSIYKKACQKLNALVRLCKILPFHKRRSNMKAFVESQFSYCPLVWMFNSRELNTKINNLHLRALRAVYMDETSSFEELLKKDGSFSIHHRNIHILATEMYKVKHKLSPIFMEDVFSENTLSNESVASGTREHNDFYVTSNPKSTNFGIETIRHIGPKIWNQIPDSIKNAKSLETFKSSIKEWTPVHCPCRLCKTYIPQLGYCNIVE